MLKKGPEMGPGRSLIGKTTVSNSRPVVVGARFSLEIVLPPQREHDCARHHSGSTIWGENRAPTTAGREFETVVFPIPRRAPPQFISW